MEKELKRILQALRLCGKDWKPGACKECTFIADCAPGDNDALLAAAYTVINDLIKANADYKGKLSQYASILQSRKTTVYIVIHRWKHGREEYRINTGRFRAGDAGKIGKTVFFQRADAENKLRRLQHV